MKGFKGLSACRGTVTKLNWRGQGGRGCNTSAGSEMRATKGDLGNVSLENLQIAGKYYFLLEIVSPFHLAWLLIDVTEITF